MSYTFPQPVALSFLTLVSLTTPAFPSLCWMDVGLSKKADSQVHQDLLNFVMTDHGISNF